jgi:hypothetical protein
LALRGDVGPLLLHDIDAVGFLDDQGAFREDIAFLAIERILLLDDVGAAADGRDLVATPSVSTPRPT